MLNQEQFARLKELYMAAYIAGADDLKARHDINNYTQVLHSLLDLEIIDAEAVCEDDEDPDFLIPTSK